MKEIEIKVRKSSYLYAALNTYNAYYNLRSKMANNWYIKTDDDEKALAVLRDAVKKKLRDILVKYHGLPSLSSSVYSYSIINNSIKFLYLAEEGTHKYKTIKINLK